MAPQFGEPGYGVPADQLKPKETTPQKELRKTPAWDEFMHPDRWKNLQTAAKRKPETIRSQSQAQPDSTSKPSTPTKARSERKK